ncbi:MAG: c-type cytochrome [Chloroflexota bacterium]
MRKLIIGLFILVSLSALVLTACGGGASGPVTGDAARGKDLYNSATLGTNSAPGCSSCHKYNEAAGKNDKAPYTAGTGTRAETRVAGMTAEEYIKESILKPNAYVVEKYKEGDMYQKWEAELSQQEIADLVAYLVTEK